MSSHSIVQNAHCPIYEWLKREKAIRSITKFVTILYFDTTQLQYLLANWSYTFNSHKKGYFSDIFKLAFLRRKDSPSYQWAGTSDQEKQIPETRHKSKINLLISNIWSTQDVQHSCQGQHTIYSETEPMCVACADVQVVLVQRRQRRIRKSHQAWYTDMTLTPKGKILSNETQNRSAI